MSNMGVINRIALNYFIEHFLSLIRSMQIIKIGRTFSIVAVEYI